MLKSKAPLNKNDFFIFSVFSLYSIFNTQRLKQSNVLFCCCPREQFGVKVATFMLTNTILRQLFLCPTAASVPNPLLTRLAAMSSITQRHRDAVHTPPASQLRTQSGELKTCPLADFLPHIFPICVTTTLRGARLRYRRRWRESTVCMMPCRRRSA